MGVTRELASFVARARYEDLSPEAIEAAKTALLNILGCCVAGNRTRIGALHVEMAKDMGGGRPQATILGDGARVSAPVAAYANGNLGFALDYEDTVKYVTHPGFITTAAGLAAGEVQGSSGRDLLLAVALGFEVVVRIGLAMQPTPARGRQVFGEQYHPFAAAVTAGKLLGLDEVQLDVALGIAGTYSSVPSAYKYFGVVADTRPMREVKLGWGWMCMAGTLAAFSAKRGFRGGHGILDGERGFYVMAGSDRCDFERITRDLGQGWMIVDTEYKGYPSLARIIPAYFAARSLVEAHGIAAGDVERIVVRGGHIPIVGDIDPRSAVDAQFSLPFVVAMAVTGDEPGPAMFSDERLFAPDVRGLLARTALEHDVEAEALFFSEQRLRFTVSITLKSGTTVRREIEFPRDQVKMGREGVEKKFRTLAGSALPAAQVERALAAVVDLDRQADLRELVAACVAPS